MILSVCAKVCERWQITRTSSQGGAHLEKFRWPVAIVCPCCGSSRKIYKLTRNDSYKCADCHKQFSVRKGTIFEESRLPLRKWFAAIWLFSSNRKGISSYQLAREIGVTQKTAWVMLGRIREVAGTVKIDFDAREAKPGSKGLRNHGTKFRISPDDICRIYAKKERLC